MEFTVTCLKKEATPLSTALIKTIIKYVIVKQLHSILKLLNIVKVKQSHS